MSVPGNYFLLSRPEIVNLISNNCHKLLDVGTGQGFFLKLVKERYGSETWGIELNENEALMAKQNSDKILVGSIENNINLLPNNYFDYITFNDVLEHTTSPDEILISLKNKLNDKGLIIISLPNVRYFFNLYDLLIKKDWEYTGAGILDKTHLRFFTKKSATRMINSCGYNIINVVGNNPIKSWKMKLFDMLTLGFFSDTKYLQYIFIAKPF
jgi:2-polyprenyl-3-methyl-5-hydroxy-6-metoxy-1,4-benzoquinol methylase